MALILERAGDWFLRSGIQEPGGGVARYYRSDLAQNAPISNEITGYAVSFLSYVYARTGQSKYLDGAVCAGRFLTRCAWRKDLGVFPFEPGSDSPAYFFDSGIIIRGLLANWHATGEAEFLDVAVEAGRGMLRHFRMDGHWAPILSVPSLEPLPYAPRWSASPGCYQLKSAMAFHDLFEISGDEAFRDGYQTALADALRTHAEFLPGDAHPDRVMDRLHAYAYFLEGLLPCAELPECRQAIRCGVERVASLLREIAPRFVRSDVYAQLLRIRLIFAPPLDETAAAEEAEAVARFEFHLLGGFGFGLKNGEMLPFVNPVSTAFCAQAIDLWQQRQPLHRHSLV